MHCLSAERDAAPAALGWLLLALGSGDRPIERAGLPVAQARTRARWRHTLGMTPMPSLVAASQLRLAERAYKNAPEREKRELRAAARLPSVPWSAIVCDCVMDAAIQ